MSHDYCLNNWVMHKILCAKHIHDMKANLPPNKTEWSKLWTYITLFMLISYVLLLTRQAGGTTTALRFCLYWHQWTLAPLSPFWRCFSICWRASKFDLLLPSCCCCSFSFSLTRAWLLWIKFLQQYDAFFGHITISNCCWKHIMISILSAIV